MFVFFHLGIHIFFSGDSESSKKAMINLACCLQGESNLGLIPYVGSGGQCELFGQYKAL